MSYKKLHALITAALLFGALNVHADALLTLSGEGTNSSGERGKFIYEFRDDKSNDCEGEWSTGTLTWVGSDSKDAICWKNSGENIEIKKLGFFSQSVLMKKPPQAGFQDLNRDTAKLFGGKKQENQTQTDAPQKTSITGRPSANITAILQQLPQSDWGQFCTLPNVLAEIRDGLISRKGLNVRSVKNIKMDHAQGGIISEYACNVQVSLSGNKEVNGMVTIKYDKNKNTTTVGWTPDGAALDVNDTRYGRKPVKVFDPQKEQFCLDQKSFANTIVNMKSSGLPISIARQEAANYDQEQLYRDNLNAAQAGVPVRRIRDPISSINLERSRLDVVELAYKNESIYKNHAGGLGGYIYDRCMGN